MIDITKSYNNQDLVDALKDRDETYENFLSELSNEYKYGDEYIAIGNKISKLSLFQKDLLYLSSKMSIYKVADLYGVSARYLYLKLSDIKKILK